MEHSLRSKEHLLEELERYPDELERVVFASHVTDDDRFRPGSDGGWGIVEILPHVRDWEQIYLERAHAFAEQDHPHILGYDDALWPIERDYRGQDPAEVMQEFRNLRAEHVAFLRSLAPENWNSPGDHSLFGAITLLWMENHVVEHDREHLQQATDVLTG